MAVQLTIEGATGAQQTNTRYQCRVTVAEGTGHTQHTVTVEKSYRDQLVGPEIPMEQLVRKSFEFLLERERKESILRLFDLRVIGSYFPEYEKDIRRAFE